MTVWFVELRPDYSFTIAPIGGRVTDHFAEISGHPTWIEDRAPDREGSTVLLLHGGLSSSESLLDSIGPALEANHRVVAFDRRGHGYTSDTPEPFHYQDMATETIGVIETVIGRPTHLVGYSDGGIVSLIVASERPDLVECLVLISTNFHHDGIYPLEIDPDSDVLAGLVEAYAARTPDGAEHFGEMAGKFMAMAATEPALTIDDLARISAPTLVMSGDDDLVKLSHTVELYEALPVARLAVVPGTSHGLPLEQPAAVGTMASTFLSSPAAPDTLMPVRRRES
jgi:pimeloyl-ACP methyl ester carboxylesterase